MKRKDVTHVPYQPLFPVRMNKGIALPRLPDLAEKIKATYQKSGSDSTQALKQARECGYQLCLARCLVDHGDWENFVKNKCGLEMRTAQRYMKIFRHAPPNWHDASDEDSKTMSEELRKNNGAGRRHIRLGKGKQ